MADIGPVEYVVIAFPGTTFNDDIVPAMREVVDAGLVRIMDFAFVAKDTHGAVAAFEITDLDPRAQDALSAAGAEASGLLNDDDVGAVGAGLAPGSAAMMIVWEDVWATKFAHAVRRSGGRVVDFQRIPPQVVTDAHQWALSR